MSRTLRTIVLAAVGLPLLAGTPAGAQVIRSYESLDRSARDGTYLTLAAGIDGRTGNVEVLDVQFSGTAGIRGERHWVRLYPAYGFQRAGGQTTDNQSSVHLRHSYFFSPRTRSFSFVQFQTDETIDLDLRFLLGGGLRRQLFELDGDGGVDLGIGVMWERERISGGAEESDIRGTNLLSVQGTAGTVALTLTGFFQPRLDDWGDHRVSAAGSALVPLGERWALDFSGLWRRDTRAPEGVEADDARLSMGMRFALN